MPLIHCTEIDAPTSPADQALYACKDPGWMAGVAAPERPMKPADNPGVLALVVLLLVFVGLNMRHVRRLFRSITQNLLSVRRRANAFDDHTAKESRTILLLLLQLCVFEGIMLFLWLTPAVGGSRNVFLSVCAMTGLAGGYYLFDLAACSLLGYVFTDHTGMVLWRRGLNASSVLLGVCLTIPALVSLFYPTMTPGMLTLAAIMYVASRITYIWKGFRIFFNNFPSLLYFILYLCTLEIIPLFAVYRLASEICNTL